MCFAALVSDKLLENPKFRIVERSVNEYSLWMNLTIKSLAFGDFGTYVCASVNALGKMESQVSLHSELFFVILFYKYLKVYRDSR